MLPFHKAANFPKLFLDFIDKAPGTEQLYGNFPDPEGFKNQIALKKFSHRDTLVASLKNQYKNIENPPQPDILLDENTFTVTTGHQLNIFTGPLYVIYKIVSTINLARKLKVAYPEYNFVPVYWMATEDHDFEEISYFNLFNQKYTWTTDQTGAVGDMDPSGILDIFDELKERPDIFYRAYSENKTLGAAVRQYMHELFGEHGLICVDGDDKGLKNLFIEVALDELEHQPTVKEIEKNAEILESIDHKPQIHARDINLFYLDKNLRERIEFNDGVYEVINTDLRFSPEEMRALVKNSPEKISPNVALRPLYQEIILPNLAYLGGPSEVAYWLQLKGVFEHFKVAFPIVMPRNMALVVTPNLKKRMEKLELTAEDIYMDEALLKKEYVAKNSENELSLESESNAIREVYEKIAIKGEEVDPTLRPTIESELVRVLKQVSNLEARIKKAEERKFDIALNQITQLKDRLFPGGSQQERTDNFLNFYLNDPEFINKIFEVFDPLDLRFNVIYT